MTPIDIATRTELFVDDFLIDRMSGATLRLHPPVKREVVLEMNQPAEAPGSCYFNCFQDGPEVRMYYRGYMPSTEKADASELQTANVAISTDGIHFHRPRVGAFEFNGSRDNAIVWQGEQAHNFFVFRDANPRAKPDERYKAVGGGWEKLCGFVSPDGLRWRPIRPEPLAIKGTFDSLNVVMWDDLAGCYRAFVRHFERIGDPSKPLDYRSIQSTTSEDFIHWSEPAKHQYTPGIPFEQFYTNATVRCPGAEHLLLSFPMRFVPDRRKISTHPHDGVCDAVFMSSRDGVHWDRRFAEAWVRPGPDERNWTERNNMPACGIIQTAPDEFSMYISEHYRHPTSRLRRMIVRRHGFASLSAGYAGGEIVTKPLLFTGKKLILNYSTSAIGSIRVEVLDAFGVPVPGRTLEDMAPLYGDELDAPVAWKEGDDLSPLIGKPIRLRVLLRDADLFALRTGAR